MVVGEELGTIKPRDGLMADIGEGFDAIRLRDGLYLRP